MQARTSCVIIMKLTIRTKNSKMTFELSQEDVESLVWTAFQYAVRNQQYQEGEEPGLEAQPEEEGEEIYGGGRIRRRRDVRDYRGGNRQHQVP